MSAANVDTLGSYRAPPRAARGASVPILATNPDPHAPILPVIGPTNLNFRLDDRIPSTEVGPVRIPNGLASLIDEGIITQVVRPLMSGKEAEVYLVQSGSDFGVAKLYKSAQNRSFKHRSQYTEGRGVRRSRDNRAMAKGSRYGRQQAEEAWKNTEVDIIYRLRDAGVRVPEPYHFYEGILVMELVTDAEGDPAHRLGDVELEPAMAELFFTILLKEVVRMTAAGIVHGDLSEFNILVGADGPVIIDFPQAVDAASNPHARDLLIRDVNNLVRFISRYDRRYARRKYGEELWDAYHSAKLTPETELTGHWRPATRGIVNTESVLRDIHESAPPTARQRHGSNRSPSPSASNRPDRRRSQAAKEPGGAVASSKESGPHGHAPEPPRRVYEPGPSRKPSHRSARRNDERPPRNDERSQRHHRPTDSPSPHRPGRRRGESQESGPTRGSARKTSTPKPTTSSRRPRHSNKRQ